MHSNTCGTTGVWHNNVCPKEGVQREGQGWEKGVSEWWRRWCWVGRGMHSGLTVQASLDKVCVRALSFPFFLDLGTENNSFSHRQGTVKRQESGHRTFGNSSSVRSQRKTEFHVDSLFKEVRWVLMVFLRIQWDKRGSIPCCCRRRILKRIRRTRAPQGVKVWGYNLEKLRFETQLDH